MWWIIDICFDYEVEVIWLILCSYRKILDFFDGKVIKKKIIFWFMNYWICRKLNICVVGFL